MSPRGKGQNDQMRKDTLEKITKAGLSVFSEYGYHGATIKKISEKTGLSYGLVYHYFAAKDDVFVYLVNLALEKAGSIFVHELDKEGTAWEKLTSLSRALLDVSLFGDSDSGLFFQIMLQALTHSGTIPGLQEKIDQYSEVIFNKLVPAVCQAQSSGEAAPGDPVLLVTAYLSLIQGLYTFADKSVVKHMTPDILLNVLKK